MTEFVQCWMVEHCGEHSQPRFDAAGVCVTIWIHHEKPALSGGLLSSWAVCRSLLDCRSRSCFRIRIQSVIIQMAQHYLPVADGVVFAAVLSMVLSSMDSGILARQLPWANLLRPHVTQLSPPGTLSGVGGVGFDRLPWRLFKVIEPLNCWRVAIPSDWQTCLCLSVSASSPQESTSTSLGVRGHCGLAH